jgi:hypothetical protein
MTKVHDRKPAAALFRDGKPHVVFQNKKVTLVSDEKLSKAQIKRAVRRAEGALANDARVQGIKPPKGRVEVDVYSDKSFRRAVGDPAIAAFSDQNFVVVNDRIARKKQSGFDTYAQAHELGHVLDYQLAGNKVHTIPSFLREGKEFLLGYKWNEKTGTVDQYKKVSAAQLKGLTAAQAKAALDDLRGPDESRAKDLTTDERVGTLYVEFLRTRLGGAGKPDALQRLEKMTARVGKGDAFAAAFEKQFGVAPQEAEAQFLAYVQQTEGKPRERLRGTTFQGL